MKRPTKVYDAIVIGSGASGGMAAKELTRHGLEVLVLEAGPMVDPARDFDMHTWPYEEMYRGFGPPGWRQKEQWVQYTATEYSRHFYVKDSEHPYTTDPGNPFMWVRARIVGGKSLHWGRLSWRLSDLDFKAASHDGYDVDWPIEYADLAPYYDLAEEFIGVSGNRDGIPHLPDGKFLPPMNLTCGEQLLKRGVQKTGRQAIVMRTAMLTATTAAQRKFGRAKCHFCGNCDNGCDVGAMFNSIASTLPVAAATGRLTLRPNSIVRQITTDPNTGQAKGVAFVDRVNYKEYQVEGHVIIVAASTLESTRLLLNSKSRQHPNGIGNNYGVLGHHLVDHLGGIGSTGFLPVLLGKDPSPGMLDGKASGLYVPRFQNLDKATTHKRFIRGYGHECWGINAGRFPSFAKRMPGFGAELKGKIRRYITAPVNAGVRGAMLSRYENFVEIDPDGVVDAWGVPVLKIHIKHSENEYEMAKDAAETSAEILHAAGAEDITTSTQLSAPGRVIHELGTARMGHDPKTSVLNKWNQVHDVKNVFVTDGAAFTSSAYVNPTLTILALTIRACDRINEEMKRGDL